MLRYLLPALAAASTAAAAACSTATATIESTADATSIAQGCTTFTGDIVISSKASGEIALDGIRKLDGGIFATGADNLNSLSASDMEEITGEFNLTNCPNLASLNFPQLTDVDAIDWTGLASLTGLSFTSGVSQASTVNIQNTQLQTLDGIELEVVSDLNLANNPFLKEANLQLKNVTNSFIVQANAKEFNVTLSNLEWAKNMTFRNCLGVQIPALVTAGGIGFFSSDMESLSAPNLTSVNGSLVFSSDNNLKNISFPKLTDVGGSLSINSTAVEEVTGFPVLENVAGAVELSGDFSSVKLPKLGNVRGAFTVESTGDISSDCSTFEGMSGSDNVIKGEFTCNSGVSQTSGSGSSATSTASGSGSTGAASTLNMPSSNVIGAAGVLAALFGLL